MKVVISEYRRGGRAQIANETQGLQGLRASIDEIAGKQQPVGSGIEMQCFEQSPEFVETPLNVANRVKRHGVSEEYEVSPE